jgi:hypothetical protein
MLQYKNSVNNELDRLLIDVGSLNTFYLPIEGCSIEVFMLVVCLHIKSIGGLLFKKLRTNL